MVSSNIEDIPAIPDLVDVVDEEVNVTIAITPQAPMAPIRTIGELENDITGSSGLLHQVQATQIPGLDLSLLIKNALCPYAQVNEEDQPWDWEVVFTQATTEARA